MAVNLAAIVPLPATFADNAGAAFAPLAGEAPLARVARTMLGAAVVAVAEPLADAVRETLAAQGLSAVGVAVAENPGSRAQCLAAGLQYLNRPAAPRPDSRHPSAVGAGSLARPGDRRAAGRQPRRDAGAGGDRQRESRRRGRLGDRHTRPLDASGRAVPARVHRRELSRLLAGRTSDDFDELDESLRAGTPITLVDGDADAFVVELPRDTAFVEAIIACRHTDPHPAGG